MANWARISVHNLFPEVEPLAKRRALEDMFLYMDDFYGKIEEAEDAVPYHVLYSKLCLEYAEAFLNGAEHALTRYVYPILDVNGDRIKAALQWIKAERRSIKGLRNLWKLN